MASVLEILFMIYEHYSVLIVTLQYLNVGRFLAFFLLLWFVCNSILLVH